MIRRTILVTLLAVSALGATTAGVSAKSGDIIARGNCSGTTDWKLKLSPEDGRIEVEFEVDQNRNDRLWRVSLTQSGTRVWSGSRYTRAPSGSFTVRRLLVNRTGPDQLVARATNAATGETCRGVATARF